MERPGDNRGHPRHHEAYLQQEMSKMKGGDLQHLHLGEIRSHTCRFSMIERILGRNEAIILFCASAKGNVSVKTVSLNISLRDGRNYVDEEEMRRRWDRVAQGLGYLQALTELRVSGLGGGRFEVRPDCRALALVIRRLPWLEALVVSCSVRDQHDWTDVVIELRNHPSLKKVRFERDTEMDSLSQICKQLRTIPNLSCVEFGVMTVQRRVLPGSFVALLGMSSLTRLSLRKCLLTGSNCLLMSGHLRHSKSRLESLDLQHCDMESPGLSQILGSLKEHRKIKDLSLSVVSLDEEEVSHAMAELVAANQSLEEMQLAGASFLDSDSDDDPPDCNPDCLYPLFTALRSGSSPIKVLSIGSVELWSHELARDFRAVLESDRCSIQDMSFLMSSLRGQGRGALACPEVMPSLASNTSLKKLLVVGGDRRGAIDIASHLASNICLEEITIIVVSVTANGDETDGFEEIDDSKRPPSDFTTARFVEALGSNTTLVSVNVKLPFSWERVAESERGRQQLAASFCGNYGICQFNVGSTCPEMVGMICQLNAAGRQYVTDDPSNTALGVQVLSAVTDNLNATFFHLLENPSLCGSVAGERPD